MEFFMMLAVIDIELSARPVLTAPFTYETIDAADVQSYIAVSNRIHIAASNVYYNVDAPSVQDDMLCHFHDSMSQTFAALVFESSYLTSNESPQQRIRSIFE